MCRTAPGKFAIKLSGGRRFTTLLFLLFFPLITFPSISSAEHKYTVYFYNPETNINNFASLKKEFDTYLSHFGEYQFQPFSEREIFEKVAAGKNDGVFLVSSWHYKNLKKLTHVEPVMIAVSRNKSTCRKILSVKKNINDLNSLKGMIVASASSEDYTKNILRQMFGKDREDILNSIKVLTVPKDIDALMSVGFGIATASLTMENSLVKLASINQKQYEMLRQLAISEETLLPILAVPKPSNKNCRKLLKILKEMETYKEGKNKLSMIGMDRWQELGEKEKRSLEKQ